MSNDPCDCTNNLTRPEVTGASVDDVKISKQLLSSPPVRSLDNIILGDTLFYLSAINVNLAYSIDYNLSITTKIIASVSCIQSFLI